MRQLVTGHVVLRDAVRAVDGERSIPVMLPALGGRLILAVFGSHDEVVECYARETDTLDVMRDAVSRLGIEEA